MQAMVPAGKPCSGPTTVKGRRPPPGLRAPSPVPPREPSAGRRSTEILGDLLREGPLNGGEGLGERPIEFGAAGKTMTTAAEALADGVHIHPFPGAEGELDAAVIRFVKQRGDFHALEAHGLLDQLVEVLVVRAAGQIGRETVTSATRFSSTSRRPSMARPQSFTFWGVSVW